MKIYVPLFLFLAFWSQTGFGQTDTLSPVNTEDLGDLLEDFFQNQEEESDFDYNAILENLEAYKRRPLDLNRADFEQLQHLGLLSDLQINSLLDYRTQAGELISIYELQAVPGFDLASIRRILPFVKVGGDLDDFQISPAKMFLQSGNDLMLRWTRVLETQAGFAPLPEGESSTRYAGDPNGFFIRFRRSFENRLSIGFNAEKDRGEEFFAGSNRQGFDFYSAHAFLRNLNKTVKAVALGDFAVSFGQGLTIYNGFAPGKSSLVTSIKRRGAPLRPYTSVNEADYLRGGGVTLAFAKNWETTLFASVKKTDANVLEADTSDTNDEAREFTSLLISGLHRTPSEIEDKNALTQITAGGNFRFNSRKGLIGVNFLFNRFDKSFQPSDQPYNRFRFSGNQLINGSLDYSKTYRNIHFFGETAMSDNGALATINGALIGLGKFANLALCQRWFEKDYQSLFAQPFAETAGGQNESGFYTGIEIKPFKNWQLSAYLDNWQHDWLRFGVDAPSAGHEYLLRATYSIRKKLEVYAQFRKEIKEKNAPENETKTDFLTPVERSQARIQLAYKFSKTLEFRSRLEWSFYDDQILPQSSGFMIYQDVIYKPLSFPVSFSTRFALFDTDDYNSRIYAFENDVLYAFSIPAFYGTGSKFYLNVRWKIFRGLTLEARYAQLFRQGDEGIGSGLELIEGNNRTDLKFQIRYLF